MNANALSRNPHTDTLHLEKERVGENVQVAAIGLSYTQGQTQEIAQILKEEPTSAAGAASIESDLADLQRRDLSLALVIDFVEKGTTPTDATLARKIASTADHHTITDGVLYFLDPKRDSQKRAVAPKALQQDIMREYHGGFMGGHFSARRLYKTLVTRWYWEKKYADACPDCMFVTGSGRR